MHKNPTKARFIIATLKCSVKPLLEVVTASLKLIYNQIGHCDFKTQYYSGVKIFWLVQNNQTVVDAINKIIKVEKIKLHAMNYMKLVIKD